MVVRTTTEQLNEFNFSGALSTIESFFWNSFTDTYVEFSKMRAWGGQGIEPKDQGSAVVALRLGLEALIKMFAPFIPYICEEVWSWRFAKETGIKSVCIAPWPKEEDFGAIALPGSPRSFDVATAVYSAVNKEKSDNQLSRAAYIENISISAAPETLRVIERIADDVKGATRCESWELLPKDGLDEEVLEVSNMQVRERE
jgi:valyl-tRNA synthetase